METYRNILTKEMIDERLAEDYTVDMGKYITDGFNIFQKNIGLFVGYALVAVLILFASIFTIVGPLLVAMPLLAGYSIAAHKLKYNQFVDFNTFFKGFKHFGDLLVLMLIMMGITLAVMIPFGITMGMMMGGLSASGMEDALSGPMFGIIALLYFAAILAMIAISTFYFFSMNLIIFSELKGWEAMEASRKMVMKHFWWILLLSIVISLISQAGSLLFYIGLIFTFPIGYCISYAAFHDIFRLGDGSEDLNDPLKHLV
jgi:uncharacterized membrane protein